MRFFDNYPEGWQIRHNFKNIPKSNAILRTCIGFHRYKQQFEILQQNGHQVTMNLGHTIFGGKHIFSFNKTIQKFKKKYKPVRYYAQTQMGEGTHNSWQSDEVTIYYTTK